jgi:RimJ/RimL family protein N-acetyltransferase
MFAITERLLLRPGWIDDAALLQSAIAHESIAFNLAKLPWPYTMGDAHWYLGQKRKEGDAVFLIFTRTDAAPRLIGGIGLHEDRGEMEIGYWITPSEWGKGYVTEAGNAVINIARHSLRLPRLVSGHFTDNPASGKVLRKLGFKPTGRIENRHCVARGELRPCALYVQELNAENAGDPLTDPVRMMMPMAA